MNRTDDTVLEREAETSWRLTADDIVPRNIRFGIVDAPVRHWYAGSLHKTALIDAFSLFLPEGERFFIRSLKHYSTALAGTDLGREITGYSIQEAFHTREHEDYNRAIAALGYDVETMEKPIRDTLGACTNPLMRLVTTCAIEHLTASLSAAVLNHPEVFEGADPAYRRLWMWHALEETEHKAVAYDIYQTVTKSMNAWQRYTLRTSIMTGVLVILMSLLLRNLRIYARNEGAKTGPGFWWTMFKVFLFQPGLGRRSLPMVLCYYSPWFNPRSKGDRDLLARGRAWLNADLAARPPAAARAIA